MVTILRDDGAEIYETRGGITVTRQRRRLLVELRISGPLHTLGHRRRRSAARYFLQWPPGLDRSLQRAWCGNPRLCRRALEDNFRPRARCVLGTPSRPNGEDAGAQLYRGRTLEDPHRLYGAARRHRSLLFEGGCEPRPLWRLRLRSCLPVRCDQSEADAPGRPARHGALPAG